MKRLPSTKSNDTAPAKLQIVIIIMFLGALLLAFGFLIGLILRRNEAQFSFSSLRSQNTATSSAASIASTLFIPTADCDSPTLVLGTSTFQVQSSAPAANGSLPLPSDTVGIAYWMEGTTTNSVFVIPPSSGNMAVMSSISSAAKVIN